ALMNFSESWASCSSCCTPWGRRTAMKRYSGSPVSARSSSTDSWARRPAVVESTPPLMPSTSTFRPEFLRQSLMKRLRRSTSATRAASSAKGGTTSRAAAISAWRLLMAGSSYAENVFQVADEVFVAALGLARCVGNLGDGLAVAGGHLDHDVHRLDARNVAGQLGADAEAYVDTTVKC